MTTGDLVPSAKPFLFGEKIDPRDVCQVKREFSFRSMYVFSMVWRPHHRCAMHRCHGVLQGALGDCWLVSALASAAEYPECLRNCFVTKEYSQRGRYVVRLWDARRRAWEHVVVDDRIACKHGTREPLFAKRHGSELWPMILEKAVAKFCGSYSALSGGFSVWAWQAMTGDPVFALMRSGAGWRCDNIEPAQASTTGRRNDVRFVVDGQLATMSDDDLWAMVRRYSRQKALLGASISKSGPGGDGPCGEQVRLPTTCL